MRSSAARCRRQPRILNQVRGAKSQALFIDMIGEGWSDTFLKIAGQNAVDAYTQDLADAATDAFDTSLSAYRGKYGVEMSTAAKHGYDALRTVADAALRAQDRQDLLDAVQKVDIDGMTGRLSFVKGLRADERAITISRITGTGIEDREVVAVPRRQRRLGHQAELSRASTRARARHPGAAVRPGRSAVKLKVVGGASVVAIAVALALPAAGASQLTQSILMLAYINAALAVAVTLSFGFTGMYNFSQASFAGAGAYTTAILTSAHSVPFLVAVLASAAVAGLLGVLLGLASPAGPDRLLRVRLDRFHRRVRELVGGEHPDLTGGANGLGVGHPGAVDPGVGAGRPGAGPTTSHWQPWPWSW